jgi:hypothetical protein
VPLGEGVELGDVVELLPPLAAPEPDLLKCASHSERDTWPSLLVSTEEKSGLEDELLEPDIPPLEPLVLEPPEAALPDDLEVSDEPDELLPEAAGADVLDEPLPEAAGEDEELLPDAAGEDEDEELCATATLDSANSAAAVAALRTLSFNMREPPEKVRGRDMHHAGCKPRAPTPPAAIGQEQGLRSPRSARRPRHAARRTASR